ncbi:hypothetical protein JXA40_02825 [bacterium]|nr:hypothetical protein [candidate division CSSED10-310 bacterium]
MKYFWVTFIMLVLPATLLCGPADADTVNDLLKSAGENYDAKKYMKALEDLDWAKQELSNMHLQIVKNLLPESISGYETRDIDGSAVFGMHNVSRQYNQGDQSIKITIAGGGSGQGGPGLSAIMGMASKFQAMDAGTQSNMILVNGRKGRFNLETATNSGTLTFELSNNVYVTVETEGFTDSSEAKKAAEKLDFEAIEKAFL